MAQILMQLERARQIDITGLSTNHLLIGTAAVCTVLWALVIQVIVS